MASPLPREKLFAWYTDFSNEDPELSRKFGNGSLLARTVRRTDDGHIICSQRLKVGPVDVPGEVRITLHPENFTYEAVLDFHKLVLQERLYEFREHAGGTLVHVKVAYTPKSRLVRLLDLVGVYERIDLKESRRTMAGYFKAAEAELGNAGT